MHWPFVAIHLRWDSVTCNQSTLIKALSFTHFPIACFLYFILAQCLCLRVELFMHIFLSTRLGALGRCGPYLIHLSKTINVTVSLLGTSSLPQKSCSINMCVLIIIMYKYFILGICLDFPWHLLNTHYVPRGFYRDTTLSLFYLA